MTRRITIHIGDDEARVLEALARRRRHSLSAEIRRAAMRHIDAEERALNDDDPRELAAGAGRGTTATHLKEEGRAGP